MRSTTDVSNVPVVLCRIDHWREHLLRRQRLCGTLPSLEGVDQFRRGVIERDYFALAASGLGTNDNDDFRRSTTLRNLVERGLVGWVQVLWRVRFGICDCSWGNSRQRRYSVARFL